jgi:UDP-GlcNAc:undecaprenyl-phosphate GlcNAc-1-phosphate transferase
MIFYLLLPFFISVAIIPFLIYISNKKNIMDFATGDDLKIHKAPTSFFGGLAMLVAIVFSLFFFGFPAPETAFFALACLIIFSLGFWDDFNWKHISQRKPYVKFLFLILCSFAAGLALYFAGVKFFMLPFLIAPFYIFVLINAVNYQDGMDGQAGILFLISVAGFYFLSAKSGDSFALLICLISFGAVLGFMAYNFPPAKIFMGDSGAYLLGIMLAALAMFFSENIVSHLLIIGLPLFDGVHINIKRLSKGKSIFLGDRQHFYDKMINKGFSVKKTLFISAGLQFIFVIAGILAYLYV